MFGQTIGNYSPLMSDLTNIIIVFAVIMLLFVIGVIILIGRIKPVHNHRDEA